MIPAVLQASGGIIVGLVTRYAGSVAKGFAVVVGTLLTGFADWFLYNHPVSNMHWTALALVLVSTFLHSKYPYVPSRLSSGAMMGTKTSPENAVSAPRNRTLKNPAQQGKKKGKKDD
jgi:hypothetical protein